MTDKQIKIKYAFDELNRLVTEPCESVYDAIMAQNKIIKLMDDLYEAGRVVGMLSTIKDTDN